MSTSNPLIEHEEATASAGKRSMRSADRVYEAVKLMAISYKFRPGERINEVELAWQLKVSRTPLREALNRLATEGFLTTLPNRGFFCRPLDARQICDLYEFRCALEASIVRLACERASEAELDQLEAFVNASKDVLDDMKAVELLRLDEEFHLRIARMSRNAEFVRSLEGINSRIHFVRWIDTQTRRAATANHLEIVALLKKREADKCAERIATHISRRYDQIVEVIRRGIVEIYMEPADGDARAVP